MSESLDKRIAGIRKYVKNINEEKERKEKEDREEYERYKQKLENLKPRIQDLIDVVNFCEENEIPIDEGKYFDLYRGMMEKGKLRFHYKREEGKINRFGTESVWIKNGVIYENGYQIHEKRDNLHNFLKKFDEFEKEFYNYIDKNYTLHDDENNIETEEEMG